MARKFKVKVNGKEYIVEVEEIKGKAATNEKIEIKQPEEIPVAVETPKVKKLAPKPDPQLQEPKESSGGEKVIKAPMSGNVIKVHVKVGDSVNAGDTLLVFEAMKMENELKTPYSGVVKQVLVKDGDTLETGQTVVVLE